MGGPTRNAILLAVRVHNTAMAAMDAERYSTPRGKREKYFGAYKERAEYEAMKIALTAVWPTPPTEE